MIADLRTLLATVWALPDNMPEILTRLARMLGHAEETAANVRAILAALEHHHTWCNALVIGEHLRFTENGVPSGLPGLPYYGIAEGTSLAVGSSERLSIQMERNVTLRFAMALGPAVIREVYVAQNVYCHGGGTPLVGFEAMAQAGVVASIVIARQS